MIAIPIPWNISKWSTMSFSSTLYLCPVLDLLLVSVPQEWQAEVRLGLQEALVNAAKHGNKLDPTKTITVKFTVTSREYCWVIADRGNDCQTDSNLDTHSNPTSSQLPIDEAENGRGFCILHHVFDYVHWNQEGTRLTLAKTVCDPKAKEVSIC